MRLLITADLHYNHPRSRPLAEDLIGQMNQAGGDVLLVIGDTASADGDDLERCLSLFQFHGPKLFVAGNHELWTRRDNSHQLLTQELPSRIRQLGWHWLQDEPFTADHLAIVGSIGWYDYSFAQENLQIPRRFYAAKVSPGAAERLPQHQHLLEHHTDISPHAADIIARWNDGQFVKLHQTDEEFLDRLLDQLSSQLKTLSQSPRRIIAAIHHLPFAQLLPPPHSAQWDFAKAYLGSEKIGRLLLQFPQISHVFCGHSHFPAQSHIGHLQAINIGSGYRKKTFLTLDVD
ncbi:MAG: metallophosphoesterase [Phycisphaerales bacterium]|jgi:predicted phosphohydrolase|nr:metallophosphoesterase [Phycisphaerales bacterium]